VTVSLSEKIECSKSMIRLHVVWHTNLAMTAAPHTHTHQLLIFVLCTSHRTSEFQTHCNCEMFVALKLNEGT